MEKPLVKAEQVARLLNIKLSTVYDAVARGRIPAVRLWKGRRRPLLRFRPEDIEELIRARRGLAVDDESSGLLVTPPAPPDPELVDSDQ